MSASGECRHWSAQNEAWCVWGVSRRVNRIGLHDDATLIEPLARQGAT
jgi:hypothetical protein